MRNLKVFNLLTSRLELFKLKQMVLFLFSYICWNCLFIYLRWGRGRGYMLEVQILTLDYPGDIDM